MNIKPLSHLACLVVFAQYSTASLAAPTEVCFQTRYDYEIFQQYGRKSPSEVDGNLDRYMSGHLMTAEYEEKYKAAKHGPAKWKAIVIKLKDVTTDGKTVIDASDSTTPSGQAKYLWHNEWFSSQFPSARLPLDFFVGLKEFTYIIRVEDPVCEIRESKVITRAGP